MAYCGPRGIPYEQWMGITDGWTPFSRGAALAWQAREAQRCPQCGQVEADWLDEEGKELRQVPFAVKTRHCHGCESLHEARADLPADAPPYLHQHFEVANRASGRDGEDASTVAG